MFDTNNFVHYFNWLWNYNIFLLKNQHGGIPYMEVGQEEMEKKNRRINNTHGASNMAFMHDDDNNRPRRHRAIANEYLPHPGLSNVKEEEKRGYHGDTTNGIEVCLHTAINVIH